MSEWVSISLDESDEGIEIQSEDNGKNIFYYNNGSAQS